jgi:hypothetical protein
LREGSAQDFRAQDHEQKPDGSSLAKGRHCERKRSNPVVFQGETDCFGGFAASQ